jgi:hypothetical protein
MTENEYDAICKKARYLEALHDEIFKLKADLESLRDTNNELILNIILVTKKGWDFHAPKSRLTSPHCLHICCCKSY